MGSGGRDPHLGPPAACQVRAIEHLASVCSSMPLPPEDSTPYQAFYDVVGSASGYSDDLAKNYTVLHSKAHVALPHRAGAGAGTLMNRFESVAVGPLWWSVGLRSGCLASVGPASFGFQPGFSRSFVVER